MKLVPSRKPPKQLISRIMIAFFLVITLAACGVHGTTTSSPPKTQSGSPAKKSVSAAKESASTPTSPLSNLNDALNPNTPQINVKTGTLLIQSSDGFQCPASATGFESKQLVLASNHVTYHNDEIQQMRNYFSSNSVTSLVLPPTLRWVLGDSTTPIPGTYESNIHCGATLNLTNIGSTPIQIPKVSAHLEASPQTNTYQYRLINYCSLIPQETLQQHGCLCPYCFGGGSNCSTYFAAIRLGQGKNNDSFSTIPEAVDSSGGACGILTIPPTKQVQLVFKFSLAENVPKNLIYLVLPTFTLDTAQGEQTLAPPQLKSVLAFAKTSQFSCYTLQGTTFVQEQSPALDPSKNWCR